jgi:hypothetical protein
MQSTDKRQYIKPKLTSHGSVEEITGWTGGGSGEFFGGNESSNGSKVAYRKNGPADFGS